MMMTSTGTSVLPLLQRRNLKKLKKDFCKFKMRNTSKITATCPGYADATS